MAQWPGLGKRLRERLVELGYRQANGKPDILGFSIKHSYLAMYLYKWANAGVMPSHENVERLAKDLDVTAPWLLFGDAVEKKPQIKGRKAGRTGGGIMLSRRRRLGGHLRSVTTRRPKFQTLYSRPA
jgi:transcriptional regulator with XRE-family HTH domain